MNTTVLAYGLDSFTRLDYYQFKGVTQKELRSLHKVLDDYI